jgi:hypothetical protein
MSVINSNDGNDLSDAEREAIYQYETNPQLLSAEESSKFLEELKQSLN